jgi:predicted RNA binding protein YcfA (HicA-like mRNA interferase family)
MTAKELVRRLEAAGWIEKRQKGSHKHFKHAGFPFTIAVPMHKGDMGKGLALAILKKAGV